MDPLLDQLVRGGVSIVTRLDDGSVGAHLVIQLDGDVINSVSPRFLTDAAAQDRHAAAIRELLGRWDRVRWAVRAVFALGAAALVALLAYFRASWPALAASLVMPIAARWCVGALYDKAIHAALNHEPPSAAPGPR
jgi:hypothetical protein